MQYKGGKNGNGTYQTIINQIPEHQVYFELFAGSAAIYRFKSRSYISVLFDNSGASIENIKTFLDPSDIALLIDSVYSRKLWITAAELLSRFDVKVFVYLDPPYPFECRSCKRNLYKHELNDRDHIALLSDLISVNFPVAISTYENSIYSEYLKDWRLIRFRSIVRGGTREEYLYMNYPKPEKLHDYRYLGSNFRDRESITRSVNNTVRKLKNADPQILNAILQELIKKQI